MEATRGIHRTAPEGGLKLVSNFPGCATQIKCTEVSPTLVRALHDFCGEIKLRFGEELKTPSQIKDLVRVFKNAIASHDRPKGRPPSKAVDLAATLRAQGVSWHRVASDVLPEFRTMSSADRTVAVDRLRRAVHMRDRRREATNEKRAS